MRLTNRQTRLGLALLVGAASLMPAPAMAAHKRHSTSASTKSKHPATSRSAHRQATAREGGRAATKPRATTKSRAVAVKSPSSASSSRRRRVKPKPLWARQHLEPQRVEEIQRALASAGYLRGEPAGQWDQPTRDAMRRYQTDNGFPATGLPEAKSLMKLGLGPHPLPADVAPASTATASLDPSSKGDSQADATPQQ